MRKSIDHVMVHLLLYLSGGHYRVTSLNACHVNGTRGRSSALDSVEYAFSTYRVKGSVVRSTGQSPRDFSRDKLTDHLVVTRVGRENGTVLTERIDQESAVYITAAVNSIRGWG